MADEPFDGWVRIGMIPGPKLAEEARISPLSDEYVSTLEQIEADGGLKPEYAERVVYVYVRQEDLDNAR